jgi:optic atrophy 3 protein
MRLSVALLRNVEAEMRAKEKAEAPTVKTKEQVEREAALKAKHPDSSVSKTPPKEAPTVQSVWRRKFRPLPEAKAVDLFADVIGDAFILAVAVALIIYEYVKSSQKPDSNLERIKALNERIDELKKREDELAESEQLQRQRVGSLEEALRNIKDPKTKKPLFPTLQLDAPAPST